MTQNLVFGIFLIIIAALSYLLYRARNASKVDNLLNHFQQRFDHLQNQLRINLDGQTQNFQQQVGNLTKDINERLNQNLKITNDSTKQVNDRMDNAAKVFSNLQTQLGKIGESNEKVFQLGKDISSLQDILKNPKSRGNLGELFLEQVLSEMLPRENYELQYSFKNNEKVDAIIKIGAHVLSVDSKFPLENFNRLIHLEDALEKTKVKKQFVSDVRKHVDSISKKYILPDEDTFDFAFMYIPSENVFYEIITRDGDIEMEISLQTYCLKKRIIPVSPNSFYAYLSSLMLALRGERMQKNIVEITAQIRQLMVDLSKFKSEFEKVGYHLNHLKNCYEISEKRLSRYEDRLEKINGFENNLDEGENQKVKLIG